MQRFPFTLKSVRSAAVPAKGRVYYGDKATPHLALCVTANGARTYYRTGRMAGKPVRYRLGTVDELTVEAARKACAELTGKVAAGHNPQTMKRQKEPTLGELWTWYLDNHSKAHKTTWLADERRWERVWSAWSKRPLSAVTTADVQARVRQVRDDAGPFAANKARELLRHMFGVAIRLGWAQTNPVTLVPRFRVQSRDRFLREDEMADFFKALDHKRTPETFKDLVTLALLCGARRGNLCSMRWDHVDLKAGVWTVPSDESKNRSAMTVVLPSAAVQLLEKRRKKVASVWVFPGRGRRGHYTEPKQAWQTLLVRAGLAKDTGKKDERDRPIIEGRTLRMHDLRRTLGSWQANLGSPLNVIGDSLGHKSLSATAIYARLQRETVRASVEKATAAIFDAAYPAKKNETA